MFGLTQPTSYKSQQAKLKKVLNDHLVKYTYLTFNQNNTQHCLLRFYLKKPKKYSICEQDKD